MFRPQPHPRVNDSDALHLSPDVVFAIQEQELVGT